MLTVAAVAFYISGHGFGHASRQIEIINALGSRLPAASILIRTSAPRWLFDRTVRVPFQWFEGECDTGVVQIDSLRLDEAETVRRAGEFYRTFGERTAREMEFLSQHRINLVISDAPPLACAAAARARVPSIVIGNFTWDWIYSGYADRFETAAPFVLPAIRAAYRDAAEAWRLPMHGGFETFTGVTDLPFVTRHARADLDRGDVRSALGLPADRPLALSSFGGYGVAGFDLSSLNCLDAWTVVITGRDVPAAVPQGVAFVEESVLYSKGLHYEDLVAACDVVVTKPGYGIIAECVANETAMLYTSRGHFLEYDVLVREMPRFLRCAFIDQELLLAGRWLEPLDALLVSPPPAERPRTDGAEVAAEMIATALVSG